MQLRHVLCRKVIMAEVNDGVVPSERARPPLPKQKERI